MLVPILATNATHMHIHTRTQTHLREETMTMNYGSTNLSFNYHPLREKRRHANVETPVFMRVIFTLLCLDDLDFVAFQQVTRPPTALTTMTSPTAMTASARSAPRNSRRTRTSEPLKTMWKSSTASEMLKYQRGVLFTVRSPAPPAVVVVIRSRMPRNTEADRWSEGLVWRASAFQL